jgi:hypothetical protein
MAIGMDMQVVLRIVSKVTLLNNNIDFIWIGPKDGNRGTITTIDCISANGSVLPPMIIMKGAYVQKQWLTNSPLPKDTR